MEKLTELKLLAAATVGALTGLWGWLGWVVMAWLGCMVMDYITGSAAAARAGEWASAKARDGIWHKLGMVVVVIVAAVSDLVISLVLGHLPLVELPITYSGMICPIVLIWYILTELGSIVENAVAMGAPVPAWMTKLLAISKEAVDKAGEALADQEDGGGEG